MSALYNMNKIENFAKITLLKIIGMYEFHATESHCFCHDITSAR